MSKTASVDAAPMITCKTIWVWICPDPKCGNYWASSTADCDLTKQLNYPSSEHGGRFMPPVGSRSECPDCKVHGRGVVHRVRRATKILL